jgi:phosphoenolpyruvate synthase/pyruvate phosphate dikinase
LSRVGCYHDTRDILRIKANKEGRKMETLLVSRESVAPHIPLEELPTNRHLVLRKLKGITASSGVVEGPCTVIRNLEDLHPLPHGTILVCEVPSPKLAPFMPFLSGLVTERGGLSAIASGYAREYGIPAVVGIKGLMATIHNGDVIRVDGERGTADLIL